MPKKRKVQQVKSGRITEIQTKRKPLTSALNQQSTAQRLSVQFNLLDDYGTICNKYEVCVLGTDLAGSFEPTPPMTQSSDCTEQFGNVKTVTSAGK